MRIGSATRICTIVATLCMRESTPLRGTDCDVFRGAFYGVSAIVALNRDAHTANVTLRGLPIGGTLTGTAWHPSGVDGGEIVLEERFAAALKQRLVTLEGVDVAPGGCLHVRVRLPLLGARTLTLTCAQ